ncbi:YhcN/YlaJ family sporulation lipoprotein [Bacillus salipaludis]|uniref:YhcN/YlaJ family sporulation lipoprotein n=1 Tax=Bacillus salipaludis TaxID=2547811 RepID=A0A4V3AT96_9BACI|nr:YhcN/YlaJ family sporulation lipoprotein [Bacillus salipaludis]MDQ6599271.1 YhcN/YlaJ family sporulation lipoprotein [Bacillus salipaludis]TDK58912.1 YhcN/YlaJ family sporulation lipoprotein [Bacillus salipaludis]
MKKTALLIGSLVFSLYLTGCGKNNVNDDVANRNRNVNEPTRVNYNPHGGPAVTGVDNSDTRLNRNNVTDVRNDNDNRNRMSVADDAANRVSDLSEVDSATVIASDNNAYVAVKLAGNDKLTNNLEDKISDKVKSVDRDIDNVYISANPDFFGQMNQWAGDIRDGRPVTGFFKEFSDAVRRVFPDLKD